jgi:hypothetical protein
MSVDPKASEVLLRRTSTYCFGASEKGLAADSLHYMSVDPKASEECDGL